MGRKVTDLEFLRYLMMKASRPVIKTKDGVSTGFLTGQGPIHEKSDTLLDRYRSQGSMNPAGLTERQINERRKSSP